MKNIAWFSELSNKDVGLVGGKGASLGEMYNAKFPIPPGFCVTSNAYRFFLEKTGLKEEIKKALEGLDASDNDNLQKTAKKIQEMMMEKDLPEKLQKDIIEAYDDMNVNSDLFKKLKGTALDIIRAGRDMPYLAVRSSATAEDLPDASFAGQQKTFLNIRGNKGLLHAVKACFASLFTARAIYYREKKGFKHMEVYLSVVVQKQVNSDVSGVMFTINPSTNNEDEIMIEAGYGLGETVVAGSIRPDTYIVDKSKVEIKDKQINEQTWKLSLDEHLKKTVKKNITPETSKKQKLGDEHINELASLGKKIEEHYGKPQDIEFAVENNRIYIVQSRPVTTLKKVEKKENEQETSSEDNNTSGETILKGLAASPGRASGVVQILEDATELNKIEKGEVLVTKMTNPDFVPAMEKASAIVTDEGGQTSHASIVSRELGIPCVVGTIDATKKLKDGMKITVDGGKGVVYAGEVGGVDEKKEEHGPAEEKPKESKHSDVITATSVYMNLGEPDKIDDYKDLDFDGIGLMRVEFIVTSEVRAHPKFLIKQGRGEEYVSKLRDGIKRVATAISPRPLIVRFSDFKTNEYDDLEGGHEFEHKESNPMIGWRGVSRYISDEYKDAFLLECKAIKEIRDSGFENVWVMLPFVRKVDEVEKCLGIMKEAGLYRTESFKIFLMAEVPSIALVPEEFAKLDIDGVSIGSNDLTQMVLGVDRDSAILGRSGYFDERNIAVKQAISNIIRGFKKNGKKVSICGQAPSQYPEIVEFLVKVGIDSISVNPDVVDKVREQIAVVERKILLDEALENK